MKEKPITLVPLCPRHIYEEQVRVRKKSELKKENWAENKKSKERTIKSVLKKSEEIESVEKKERTLVSIYANESDVKASFLAKQLMFVLSYKDAYFSANVFNPSLPSVVKSLLQDFENVFLKDVPNGLPPIRGIEHQIVFILKVVILN